MAGLPINIPIPAENSLVTYNYQDLITQQGSLSVSCLTALEFGGTKKNYMTKSSLYSNDLYTDVVSGTPIYFETDFFNKQTIIYGNLTATFSFLICRSTSGAGTAYVDFTVTVSKLSGGITTLLSTGPTQQFSGTEIWTNGAVGVGGPVSHILNIPKTVLKSGDKLILSITGVLSGTNPMSKIFHDPMGRKSIPNITFSAEQDTKLNVDIPIKIDL